jgi:hypothetical protein
MKKFKKEDYSDDFEGIAPGYCVFGIDLLI